MTASTSTLLATVRRLTGEPRRRASRAALDAARPWEEWRPALGTALAQDPHGAQPAISALAEEAGRRSDLRLHARLRLFEAYAAHRAGRMDDAIRLYGRAERLFAKTGSAMEAATTAIARVDALAASGRVDAALALASRIPARLVGEHAASAGAILATNRGNALRLRGDIDEARRAYADATRTFERLGDRRRAEVTRLNGAVAAVEAGDAEAGRAQIEIAHRAFVAGGFADLAMEARTNLAWADVLSGRLGEGIRALDRLADEHRTGGLDRREGVCRMDLADALHRAGDAAAGAREAARAADCFARAGAVAERAEALAIAAVATTPASAARPLAQRALAAARRSGREALALRVELSSPTGPSTPEGGRDRPAARRIANRARTLGHRALEADARLLEGSISLAQHRGAAAGRAFASARRLATGRPWTRFAAEAGLAALEARRPGGVGRAIARLRRITDEVDAIGADLPGSWLRSRFATDRLDPHLVRVDLLLSRGRAADRREAEAILDGLAARRVLRPRTRRGGDGTDRIRARLEALYDRIARGDGPTRGGEGASTAALERRARAWERAFVARRGRSERRAPADRSPAHAHRHAGASGATSIHVWRRGDDVLALVDLEDGITGAIRLPPIGVWHAWAAGIRFHTSSHRHLNDTVTGATDAATGLLRAIGRRLLPSLEVDRWLPSVRLTVDPSVPDLPFESLHWLGRPLGLTHAVLRTPLGRLAPVARRTGRGTVVVGVGAPDLPGVDDELRRLAALRPASRVLERGDATRAALAGALATAAVVHVAGHGWDAVDAPPLAGVRLADGWFCAEDVPARVSADLVVLAACRTGRAEGPASLAWGGLVSRLLSSGARRVIWTDDDVDDRTTARLMGDFHATRGRCDDETAFGRSVARIALESRHIGAVLPFRISGVAS